MTVRPARAANASGTVPLTGPSGSTDFQADLLQARNSKEPWKGMVTVVRQYEASAAFANPLTTLKRGAQLQAFGEKVSAPLTGDVLTALQKLVQSVFGQTPSALLAGDDFKSDWTRIDDSVIALFISPEAGRDLAGPLTQLARLIGLLQRIAASDTSLNAPDAVAEALARLLLLPQALFPLNPGMVKPVGVGDLLVVRQRLTRYELSDVASIENVLQKELKKHTTKHTLITERDTTFETETTTVTESETQTDERFALKRESQAILKEDLSVKAGLAVSYHSDTLEMKTNLDVAYERAKSDSVKISGDYARDVTLRAASKVTERVLARESRKMTEVFEETDEHAFNAPSQNIVGVYQWLNKVYTAQVFNYRPRLLFDIAIPEPAAFLIDATAPPAPGGSGFVEPLPFHLRPSDLVHDNPESPNYFQKFFAQYGVTGFETPPPLSYTTVAKGISLTAPDADDRTNLLWSGELGIPSEYRPTGIAVNGRFNFSFPVKGDEKAFHGMRVTVGSATFICSSDGSWSGNTAEINDPKFQQASSIPIALSTTLAYDCSVNVEVSCVLTETALAAWKLKAHAAIVQACDQRRNEYQDAVQQQAFRPQAAAALPVANPAGLRALEQTELKKAAIQILGGWDLDKGGFGAVLDGPAGLLPDKDRSYPRTNLSKAQQEGSHIRFFEQAFEWEKMSYFLYPYHWARPETWFDRALLDHDDPLFADFLRAGEARTVIPVRPGFETDVWYYLITGQIWEGGEMPCTTDIDYLSIAKEIQSATGAPEGETPQDSSWEIRVPTRLIRLRDDGKLPEWTKTGDWTWTGR
jgi:hypothetical protein